MPGAGGGRGEAPSSNGEAAAGRGGRYLLGGAGAAGDERQRRQAVQQEAAQGDGVRGQPQRDLLHQPGPVGLQPRLQQRLPGRAVAVLLQPLQLRRAEGRGQSPGHGHAGTAEPPLTAPRTGRHRGQPVAVAAARGGAELRVAAQQREAEEAAAQRVFCRGEAAAEADGRPSSAAGAPLVPSRLARPPPRGLVAGRVALAPLAAGSGRSPRQSGERAPGERALPVCPGPRAGTACVPAPRHRRAPAESPSPLSFSPFVLFSFWHVL